MLLTRSILSYLDHPPRYGVLHASVLEKRKEQASATMRKVYGDKPKGSIGEID